MRKGIVKYKVMLAWYRQGGGRNRPPEWKNRNVEGQATGCAMVKQHGSGMRAAVQQREGGASVEKATMAGGQAERYKKARAGSGTYGW